MPDAMSSPDVSAPARSVMFSSVAVAGRTSLKCRGSGLLSGPIRFASAGCCSGLDHGQVNIGDPGAFLTVIVGTVMAAWAEVLASHAHFLLWLHMSLWLPLIATGMIVRPRVAEGALRAIEYCNGSREGRLSRQGGAA